MRALSTAALVLLVAASALAAPPEAGDIVQRLKRALEPEKPSLRQLTFRVGVEAQMAEVVVGEARKRVGGKVRHLLVALAPEGIRGTAYLVEDGGEAADTQWIYLPAVRRVRTVVSPEAYTAFLNSDFTYADLGFVSMRATYRVLGEETLDGVRTFEVEGVPRASWYYARFVTWVAADAGMPVKRHFHDPANELWKVERWDAPTIVDGVPTVLHFSMEDVQAGTRTDVHVSAVRYDVVLPDGLFEPGKLPQAAAEPSWAQLRR